MDDPMIKRVTTATERDRAFTKAKKDKTAPQEIIFDNTRSSTTFYVNINQNINIELSNNFLSLVKTCEAKNELSSKT